MFTFEEDRSERALKCLFLYNLYNIYAKRYGFRKALKLTIERKKLIYNLMEEYGEEDFKLFIQMFRKSISFFRNQNWMSIEWICKHFLDVMEGKYIQKYDFTYKPFAGDKIKSDIKVNRSEY